MKQTSLKESRFWPVLLLLGANSFTNASAAPYNGFISAFYDGQGLSKTQIGILLSVTAVASICIQPLWAWLSDRTGSRRAVLCVVVAGSALSALGFYLAHGFAGYLLAAMVYACFITAIGPLCDALVVQQCSHIGMNFARIRLSGTIAFAVVVYFVGMVLVQNIRLLFLLSTFLYLIMLLIVSRFPKHLDTKTQPRLRAKTTLPKQAISRGKMFSSRRVGFILALALVMHIGLAFNGAYMPIHLLELGHSEQILGLSNSISALSEIPVLLFMSKHLKRWDIMKLITFASVMLCVRLLLVPTGILPLMLFSQAFQGVTYIVLYYACVMYLNEHVVSGRISQAQSVYVIITNGFGGAIGQIGGGFLVEQAGLRTSFYFVSAGVLVGAGVILALYLLCKKQGWRSFA